MGMTLYLPRAIVGYDVNHEGPDLGLMERVSGNAESATLPFEDEAFDFVVSMDMLEHVSAERRRAMVSEMVRVSRGWVVVGTPCGRVSLEYDRRLHRWCQSRLGIDYRWVREHLTMGLPEADEVEAMIRDATRERGAWEIASEDNFHAETWLRVWRFQMSRWRVWRSLKNKVLWPAMRWIARRGSGPAYRKVFIARRVGEGDGAVENQG